MNIHKHPNQHDILTDLQNDIQKTLISSDKTKYQHLYFKSGGVFRTILETLALFLEKIYQELYRMIPNLFSHTARDAWLDQIAKQYGITREHATPTKGIVTFSRKNADTEITIPVGKIIATEPNIHGQVFRYVTIAETILKEGEFTGKTIVHAEKKGSAYNILENKITTFTTPINGIDHVINHENWIIELGKDTESDEMLQQRCSAFWGSINGANAIAYESWAKYFHQVHTAITYVNEKNQGTVTILVLGKDNFPLGSSDLDNVASYIESRRPIGVEVIVQSPIFVEINSTITIVHHRSYALTDDEINNHIDTFFYGMNIGQDVESSALIAHIFKLPNIQSVSVNIDSKTINDKQLLADDDTRINISHMQIARKGKMIISRIANEEIY